MKRLILAVVILIAVAASGAAYGAVPAVVTDISDRAYEDAVIELLDGAKESLVISMVISVPSHKGTPCGSERRF